MSRSLKYKELLFFILLIFSIKRGIAKNITETLKEYSDNGHFGKNVNLTGSGISSHFSNQNSIEVEIISSSLPCTHGHEAAKVLDGNMETYWKPHRQEVLYFITFKLKQKLSRFSVGLLNYGDGQHDIKTFGLATSDDQASWVDLPPLRNVDTGTRNFQYFDYDIFGQTGMYLMFVASTADGDQPWLCELAFSTTRPTTPPATKTTPVMTTKTSPLTTVPPVSTTTISATTTASVDEDLPIKGLINATEEYQVGHGPMKAIDINDDSYWQPIASKDDKEFFITVELEDTYIVTGMEMLFEGHSKNDVTFTLEVSEDLITWYEVCSYSNYASESNAVGPVWKDCHVSKARARTGNKARIGTTAPQTYTMTVNGKKVECTIKPDCKNKKGRCMPVDPKSEKYCEEDLKGVFDNTMCGKKTCGCCKLPKPVDSKKCNWDWDVDFGGEKEEHLKPLILDNDNNLVHPKLIEKYEYEWRIVSVAIDTMLTIACPGTGNYITTFGSEVQVAKAKCKAGNLLEIPVNGQPEVYPMNAMKCQSFIKGNIIEPNTPPSGFCSGKTVPINAKYYEIGFPIKADITNFYQLIHICYDDDGGLEPRLREPRLLMTGHELHGESISARDKAASYSWVTPDGITPNGMSNKLPELYKQLSQTKYFDVQHPGIGLCINGVAEQYFARGHMSPAADFVTQAEQRATYHLANAVPQWQMFNNANWMKIEEKTQDLAKTGRKFQIYSGSSKKEDALYINGIKILFDEGKGYNLLVPAFTWKVVYEKGTGTNPGKGVAFKVTNDPVKKFDLSKYDGTPPDKENDICEKINWIWSLNENGKFWGRDEKRKGLVECFEVNYFRKEYVPYVPALDVKDGIDGILNK